MGGRVILGSVILMCWCRAADGQAPAGAPFGAPPTLPAVLKVGDVAPPISVSDWVKGQPFDMAKEGVGKVILLEFWATWCMPCIQMIPETNELYHRYKDKGLVLVSIADTTGGDTLKKVQDFVSRQGSQMDYPVAFDATQKTSATYVAGTGSPGIPHCAVIGKDGRLAWAGHPANPELRQTIEDLLLDRFSATEREARQARRARIEPLLMEFNQGAMRRDWDQALATLDKVLEIDPSQPEALRLRVAITLDEVKSPEKLRSWARQHIEKNEASAEAMVAMTSALMSNAVPTKRLPDLALAAGRLAVKADARSSAAAAALASVLWQIGAVDQALEAQRQAVAAANVFQAEDARAVLEYYEKCRKLATEPSGS